MAYTINTLANIAPVLLREGLLALRENSIMVRLCQFDVSEEASQKGATINVELPSAVPAQEVALTGVPGDFFGMNTATALVPTVIPVTLDNWYESVFSMSDKDIQEVKDGTLPAAASEAIKSLANVVDVDCLGLYKDLYGAYGAAAATPSAISDITGPRKVLNAQLCPLGDRALMLDVEAEAKFLQLAAFHEADKVGDTMALREGSLGRKLGFDIFMDQNVLTHTSGTLTAAADIASKGIVAIGAKTMTLDDSGAGALTGTLVAGDIITFATSTQQHVITALATAAANEIVITFEPGLKVATADGTVVTLVADHTVNMAFHKQAFCFVSRPLAVAEGLGSIVESVVDPISGLALRLEISRVNKQTRWSYDILWGTEDNSERVRLSPAWLIR